MNAVYFGESVTLCIYISCVEFDSYGNDCSRTKEFLSLTKIDSNDSFSIYDSISTTVAMLMGTNLFKTYITTVLMCYTTSVVSVSKTALLVLCYY